MQGGNSAAEKGGRLVEFSTTTRTVHKRDVWEVTSNYINTSFTINNDSISCYIKCDKTPLVTQRTVSLFWGKVGTSLSLLKSCKDDWTEGLSTLLSLNHDCPWQQRSPNLNEVIQSPNHDVSMNLAKLISHLNLTKPTGFLKGHPLLCFWFFPGRYCVTTSSTALWSWYSRRWEKRRSSTDKRLLTIENTEVSGPRWLVI